MTTNQNPQSYKPLVLGLKKALTVDPQLDSDGDLELFLETGCDYSGHYVFLSRKDQIALRDHLNMLLKEDGTK
jgi:hypothetical protein